MESAIDEALGKAEGRRLAGEVVVAPIRLRRSVEIGHRDLKTDDIAEQEVSSYTALLFGGDDIIIGGDVDFEHHSRRPTARRSAAMAQRRLIEPCGLPRIAQYTRNTTSYKPI